jgi:hypothetical protein
LLFDELIEIFCIKIDFGIFVCIRINQLGWYSSEIHQEVHNLGDNNDDNTRVRFLEVGDIGNFNNITTHNFF